MTPNSRPPRLALWLLERFASNTEPLAGDLVESFATTGSRSWFWRQVLAAILLARFTAPRETRPLRLVDREPLVEVPRAASVTRPINLTASPIHGIGGLGLVALGIAISAVDVRLWWLAVTVVLFVAVTGLLLGLAFIVVRRPDPPHVTRSVTCQSGH